LGQPDRPDDRRLVLLVDDDADSRRHTRHLLELHGMQVVQASNGMAALELIQRLPQSFRLVITEMDLPGLPGAVVQETLRIFRPDLPALCISSRAVDGRRCLSKPLQAPELLAAIREAPGVYGSDGGGPPEAHVARARACYARVGDLVEAALELARAGNQEN
jgi:CheY-like chemotaxis protein